MHFEPDAADDVAASESKMRQLLDDDVTVVFVGKHASSHVSQLLLFIYMQCRLTHVLCEITFTLYTAVVLVH